MANLTTLVTRNLRQTNFLEPGSTVKHVMTQSRMRISSRNANANTVSIQIRQFLIRH